VEPTAILLVDDEEDIRDVLALSLADMGYAVTCAEDGEHGLSAFQRHHPAIVLTDIKMPGMDGIELLRRIKREDPDTEVVMITGHGDMDLAVKSLKYEASDFITKPINSDALEIALKRVCDRIAMKRQLRAYTESLEALVKEKSELQSHLASLGLMIGSISHGIKGLLTGLDGAIYLLDSGLAKDNPARIEEGWEALKRQVGLIRKMVLDILFCAKKREIQYETVEIAVFAEELGRVFAPRAASQQIGFLQRFEIRDGRMEIDAGYLQSALLNLLDNAVDACRRDGTQPQHTIRLTVREDPETVAFEIADDGIGMDLEVRERLYTLFYSSKGKQGTGLGLFITREIVEQHGGAIEVRSTPGRGSCFEVRIPKHHPPTPAVVPE
jgi:signal transduction histidine kinase